MKTAERKKVRVTEKEEEFIRRITEEMRWDEMRWDYSEDKEEEIERIESRLDIR